MAKRDMKTKEVETVTVEVEAPVTEEVKKDATGIVAATGYDKLNIRKAPKSNSEVVTTVANGTKLTIVDVEKATGDWYKVKTEDFNGYCMKKYIKLD